MGFFLKSSFGADSDFEKLLFRDLHEKNLLSSEERIEYLSKILLGKKYLREALGEGEDAVIDRDPLYRWDSFDCTTFVETLLAVGRSKNKDNFSQHIQNIRYVNGDVDYFMRRHFPDLDWMPGLIEAGYIKDITKKLALEEVEKVRIEIDKASWFKLKQKEKNKLKAFQVFRKRDLAKRYKSAIASFPSKKVVYDYIPLRTLFKKESSLYSFHKKLLDRLPRISFVNVVKIPLKKIPKLGTKLSIWHQALLIKTENSFLLRHAYIGTKKVSEMEAIDFFLYLHLQSFLTKNRYSDYGLSFFVPQ